MLFKKPRISPNDNCTSLEIFKEAISEYGIDSDCISEYQLLSLLKIDDIDFVEAMQLVEKVIDSKIDIRSVNRYTTIKDVVDLIDSARSLQ